MKKKLINKLQFAIDDNIYDVIKQIKLLSKYTNKTPIAFIKNRFGQCVGTLTLSDFYRVKKKKNLIIRNVMNKKFIFINKFYSENLILRKFENFFLRGDPNVKTIPVLNKNKIIIDLINFEDFQKKKSLINSNKKPKIKFVSVKIPARLSFSGGGTDFSNLINENKIYVISSSIDKYIKVEINILKKKSQFLLIENKKINLKKKQNFKKYKLIYKILEFYNIQFGFNLKVESDFSRGSGLGGSSVLTVAIVSALDKILFGKVNFKHVINKSYRIERIDSKISGGWQDFFTSTYGGFCWIMMNKKDIDVKKMRISNKNKEIIQKNLIFFKFGKPRDSSKIQLKLENKIKKSKIIFKDYINRMNKVTHDLKFTLMSGNVRKLGQLQNKNWLLKKEINKNSSNHHVNNLYSKILNMGAYGGKILGAGNSGYLMINSDEKYQKNIIRYLTKFGYTEDKIKFTHNGIKISTKKL